MPDRLSGLSFAAWSINGTAYLGDIQEVQVAVTNKTAEGKGIADRDDYPVLTGRGTELTAKMLINTTGTLTGTLNAFSLSNSPAGTILITTGMGAYSGTVVVTNATWKASREALQEYDVTLLARGAFPFA